MLKEFIYNWKIKQALKKTSERKTVSFEKAKSIGMLFDDEANYEKTKNFIKSLIADGKSVTTLIKSKEKEPPTHNHYTEKECKWNGSTSSEAITHFFNKKFDYLFLLNETPHFLTEYILAKSQSNCKVGIYNEKKEPFFELMFANEKKEPIDKFYKTVKGYLDKIK